MISDFFRGFTATHKTIVIVAAIVTPGALYGAVTFQAVSIVDPNTGANTFVDTGRRLYVYDPISGYANNPANFVRISGQVASDGVLHTAYTVPVGKAFILKSVDMSYFNGTVGSDNYTYFYDVSGGAVTFIAGFDDGNQFGTHNVVLGNGWYLHSGAILEYDSSSGGTMSTEFSIEGYLVPSGAVPAAASLEGSQQTVRIGNVTKK